MTYTVSSGTLNSSIPYHTTSPDPFWTYCIAVMDDNADAKRILSALAPEDWRRPRGRPLW